MSSGNDPDVDFGRSRRADFVDLALLDEPKDANLQFQRHLPDLVEEDRAPIRRFDAAFLVSQSSGEGPLHVTK
jgi:hypothetical protein